MTMPLNTQFDRVKEITSDFYDSLPLESELRKLKQSALEKIEQMKAGKESK